MLTAPTAYVNPISPAPFRIEQPELLWYAVHIRSQQEAIVENWLRRRNLETLLPRIAVPSRRRDRRLLLEVPLFPGYLFVQADLETSMYFDIIKHRSVVRILGTNGQLTPVPDETVANIQMMLQSGLPLYPHHRIESGKRVRVVEGPLLGTCGVVLRRKEGTRRLVVSVELLGRSLMADLAEESVEPA